MTVLGIRNVVLFRFRSAEARRPFVGNGSRESRIRFHERSFVVLWPDRASVQHNASPLTCCWPGLPLALATTPHFLTRRDHSSLIPKPTRDSV